MSTVTDPKTGYQCERPIDLVTDRGEFRIACYKCRRCRAGRKQDVVGRVIAQAVISAHVLFVTLTYRDGSPGAKSFCKADWDLAINRLRMQVGRAFGTKVKVLFAFERGLNRSKRCHVHAILMFDGPHGLQAWDQPADEAHRMPFRAIRRPVGSAGDIPADPKARVHFDFWEWGHVNVQDLKSDHGLADLARSVRYVAKYLWSDDAEAPFGWSTRELGTDFLRDLARQHADAGLVPKGFYFLPGLIFTSGKLAGNHQRFYMRGAGAREFAKAFRLRWEDRYPGETAPALPWILAADDEAIDPALVERGYRRPTGWKPRAKDRWEPRDCTAAKTVHVAGWFAGTVRLDEVGRAAFHPRDGAEPIRLEFDLAQLPVGVDLAQRIVLTEWINTVRGTGWRPPEVVQAERDRVISALASRDPRSRIGDAMTAASPSGDPDRRAAPKLSRAVLAAKLREP